jgi:hypothetical protein
MSFIFRIIWECFFLPRFYSLKFLLWKTFVSAVRGIEMVSFFFVLTECTVQLMFRFKFLCQRSNRMQIYLATLGKSRILLQFVSSVCEECSWWALCQEFLKCAIVCNKILLLFMAWASYTVCTQQATHFLQNVQLKGRSNQTTVGQLWGNGTYNNIFFIVCKFIVLT